MQLATGAFRGPRTILLVLAGLLALPGSAAPGDGEVWITIERSKLSAFEAAESGASDDVDAGAALSDLALPEIVAAPFTEARIDTLVAFMHEHYRVCGGFMAHASQEAAIREAARASGPPAEAPAPPVEYTIDNGPVVQALIGGLDEANIRATITSLSNFFTRRHNCASGLQSATWIRDLWAGYAASRPDVTVEFFNHSGTPQPSVILTIPGQAGETGIVVLGAHQDSTAGSNCTTSRSPGADDDATGVAVLSELIRAALALGYQPQQTVRFMAYAAEEVGLVGSDEIATSYGQQGANVLGVIQFDMTNYHGSLADIYLITDFTSAAQNTFLAQLADEYLASAGPAGTLRGTTQCGYGCSDHASWNAQGYPASFPFEARMSDSNPFIHSAQDTLANMGGNAIQTLQFTRLAAAYMAELAKGGLTTYRTRPALAPPGTAAGALGNRPFTRR